MKQLFFILLVVALAALLGYGALHASGRQPFAHEMILAMLPPLLAAMAALLPALMQRPFGQAAVVQGAFHGMIIHLAMTLLLGLAVFFFCRIHGPAVQPFALWLTWFFWVTLAAVSKSLVRTIKTTPIAPADVPQQ